MLVNFYKLEGTGNDFILLDSRNSGFVPKKNSVVAWCDRRFGIGGDGVLVLLKPGSKEADFKMRILNSDGSEAEMCGNGIRCLARYVFDHKLSEKNLLAVDTLAGLVRVEKIGAQFRVAMARPEFDPRKIPVKSKEPVINKKFKFDGKEYKITCLSMGNPHCVIVVKDVSKIALDEIGPKIERHPMFPKRVNVEFVQVVSKGRLKMRVWERGAGETLACGTGACAALAACNRLGLVAKKALINLPGGDLFIEWDDVCRLTGPARFVFQGWLDIGK
jgi:diaminopimelate epimerase